VAEPSRLTGLGRAELLAQARSGDVVVIDVRPRAEYDVAHLPYARSMPLADITQRLAELPTDKEIVAYCRGPFCLFSDEACQLLHSEWLPGDGWGLLNHFQVPFAIAVPLAVIAMDFVIWLQHVMVHAVPALWRLHRVHHADLDYDVTTGARFHPLEIILSMLIKFATIVVLGPPVVAVVIFEVLLNATAMFNHGNIRLPAGLDRVLRWVVVTPDMHRVHHSVEDDETNSNFGFNLPWWDRLFGTYRDQPRAGHVGMTIGIRSASQPEAQPPAHQTA
jgi:sterol desaturase/sphingolipid hydroxylase (fatty acid hydroxylase superfamily)